MSRKRIVPKAEFVTADMGSFTAYCWRIDGYGISVLGDTQKEVVEKFPVVFEAEYEKPF